MIRNGIALRKSGKTIEQILEKLKMYPNQTEMYLLPESMTQLKRSGRVSTTQAVFASLLNINLLLRFQNGKVIVRSEEHTSELQSRGHLVCRLLLEKKKNIK